MLSQISVDILRAYVYDRGMKKPTIPDDVMEYFRKTGSMGGQTRAEKHSKEQLSAWAKLGGRPKGSGKNQKQAQKGTKAKGGK
jgi:hypothetical protein